MAQVLCFGNLQFDILCRTVTELPAPGRIRKIDAIDSVLSGNAGNVAAALARLGIEVELAGYSGADLVGEQFRSMLAELGVGIEKLLRHPHATTGTSVVTLAPNGERSVIFVNGANELFDLATVPDSWLAGQSVVLVSSIFVLPQFTGEAVAQLFARARANGSITVLNICYDSLGYGLSFLAPALRETDYFILNEDEGRQLSGQTEPQSIIETLEAYTRGPVILTLGEDGCCLRDTDGFQRIPAVAVEATDCTGAGDSFVAGFIAGLVNGRSPYDCARLGCQVAAFAVSGPGAYSRVPSFTEIDSLIGSRIGGNH